MKSSPYTLNAKISSDNSFETFRGSDDKGLPAIIRVDSANNGSVLVKDGSICSRVREFASNKKQLFANYFPDSSWNDRQPGYVIHSIPQSALSLSEVSKAFSRDIPLADAAWMINRLLEALHLVHSADYIHANITPDTFFIVPETHEGKLIGFENSIAYVAGGVTAYNTWHTNHNWPAFYPKEYVDKENGLTPSVDVYMASMVMGYLLPALPEDSPEELNNLILACQLSQFKRIQTIRELHEDFNKIIKANFGPRKFRPLIMP